MLMLSTDRTHSTSGPSCCRVYSCSVWGWRPVAPLTAAILGSISPHRSAPPIGSAINNGVSRVRRHHHRSHCDGGDSRSDVDVDYFHRSCSWEKEMNKPGVE